MSEKLEKILSESQFRCATFERADMDTDKRTVALSFSSEEPVERFYGFEILDHSKSAVDLSRLKRGGPLLLHHDTREHIGVVESCEITPDRKGRAIVRFSKSAKGEEAFREVQDGTLVNISVGYRILEMVPDGKKDGLEAYRAVRWQPYEVSVVTVPADINVGVGRNHQPPVEHTMHINRNPAPSEGGGGTPAPAPAPAPTVNVQEIESRGADNFRKRMKEIRELAKLTKKPHIVELGERCIEEGVTIEEFQNRVVRSMGAEPVTPAESNPAIGMSKKEVSQYSLVRAIRTLAEGKPLDGLEAEASREVAAKTRQTPKGFFVPADVSGAQFRRASNDARALNVNSQTAGGYLVGTETQWASMIDLLRNSRVMNRLGARTLSGLVGNIAIPKQTGGATAYWLSETEEVTASQQTFGQLYLVPHRLGARTAYTKQLVSQASPDVESLVREDVMTVLAIEQDRVAINGSGVGGEPLGILNTTGINSLTFGGAPTWTDAVDFEKLVEDDNVPFNGSEAYITTPTAKAKWKTTEAFSSTGVVLWKDNTVNGYPSLSTKQVPSDKMIFGKWSDLIIADWDGIDVTVDNITLASTAQIQIIIHMLTDCGVRNAVSFAASSDSAAQ